LSRLAHRLAAIRDAAFEIHDEQVGFAHDRYELGGQQLVAGIRREPLGHTAPEHRVARKRDPDRHRRTVAPARHGCWVARRMQRTGAEMARA
jgi:hypothetical protein